MGTNELPSEIRRFKEIREDHDFTQSEFAEQLGIKHSTADIERGRTKLSGRVVTELLRLFHVNPLWLFGYSNQKHLNTDSGDISPKVVIVDKEDQENMVLVNQKAAAGYPNNIQDVEWYQKLPAFDTKRFLIVYENCPSFRVIASGKLIITFKLITIEF